MNFGMTDLKSVKLDLATCNERETYSPLNSIGQFHTTSRINSALQVILLVKIHKIRIDLNTDRPSQFFAISNIYFGRRIVLSCIQVFFLEWAIGSVDMNN